MVSQTGSQACSQTRILSWNDLEKVCPQDPRDLIAYAEIAGTPGEYDLSSAYANQTWGVTPLALNKKATVSALESDNMLKQADATQWNFSHLTWNDSSTLAEPLKKMVFLRAGTQWENVLHFDFGGTTIEEVQISFLTNAATRGDKQGTIPVIRWTDGTWTGNTVVKLVFKKAGIHTLGIWTYDGTDYAMYDLVVCLVP